jgi:structural maintenance of chromosome 3 (chondroitin sulfate proteoglycan 6)
MNQLQKIEQRRLQLDSSYAPLRQELRNAGMELQRQRDALEAKLRAKDNIATEERRLSDEQEAYEAELATDFKKALSQSEEQQLESLGSTVQDLRKQLSSLSGKRAELEAKKRSLEVELGENLRLRLDQLNTQDVDTGNDGDVSGGNVDSRLKDRERELTRVNKILEALEAKIKESELSIDRAKKDLANVQQSKSAKQQEQEELARTIERHQKRMEKSMQKKALLTEKLADCNRDIRDLGVLPEEAFKKYEKLESDKVSLKNSSSLLIMTNSTRPLNVFIRSKRPSRSTLMSTRRLLNSITISQNNAKLSRNVAANSILRSGLSRSSSSISICARTKLSSEPSSKCRRNLPPSSKS